MEAIARRGSPFNMGAGSQARGPTWGHFSFRPSSALFWLVRMLFESRPLEGEGFAQFPLPLSLLVPSSFLGQPVREGARQVKEWETLNELSSQVHPSQVDSLSIPANYTSICTECPSHQLLVRSVGRGQ